MKTYSPKQSDIQRAWFIVDVKGKTLGKVATKLADIIRGKNKPTFSPHMDCGDFVVVINAKEIHLTGNKTADKVYYRHTKYPGGLRETTAAQYKESKPERILENAVAGMVPRNKLKKDILSKLKVYGGPDHIHQAQNPQPLEI
jgi:large subunit ribosomal protein L13